MKELLDKQKQLCAEAVKAEYQKSGMTNLAKRAYDACLGAEDAEPKKHKQHKPYVKYNPKVHDKIAYISMKRYKKRYKLAEALGVSLPTIKNWHMAHQSFRDAYERGKYEYYPYLWKGKIPPEFNIQSEL